MNTIITVESAGPDQATIEITQKRFLESTAIRKELDKGAKLLTFHAVEAEKSDRSPGGFDNFEAVLYNYNEHFAINATGKFSTPDKPKLRRSALQPLPTGFELNEAIRQASADPLIQAAIADGRAQLFPAMPGVIGEPQADGSTRRLIPLVLHPTLAQGMSEILAVDLGSNTVTRGLASQPARAEFFQDRIFPVPSRPIPFPIETNNQEHVWFTIKDAVSNAVIWKMLIVRPAASSGTGDNNGNGSGLELRYVDYKGKRVFHRAHAPIWNVLYENRILEFRDWTNAESGFDATGTFFKDASGNDLPHFIQCTSEPKTVFESGQDGLFTGVAFFQNADGSWTISTMMAAGWYRYYMAYTFFADGTIKPRIGFTTNGTNPHADKLHFHNAYFRFDFDIEGAANDVIEIDQITIHWNPGTQNFEVKHEIQALSFEQKLNRVSLTNFGGQTTYRVRDKGIDSKGYRIVAGSHDGSAIADTYDFSKGDIWALKYQANEIDDGVVKLTTPSDAQLDRFVNGEAIDGADVVFWYAVHFSHDPMHTMGEKDFGPNLYAFGAW
jgi:Copper amine oxidase, enzyme domain